MQVDFGKGAQPVTPVQTPAENAAVDAAKPAQTSTLPAVVPPSPGVPAKTGFVLGDQLPGFEDIILPRVNLVYDTGNLKDQFHPGSIVFRRTTVLFTPPDIDKATGVVRRAASAPAFVTVLGFRPTRYVEKPDVYSPGVSNLIVNTEEEVRAYGGTLDYKEYQLKKAAGMKRFEPLADAVVLLERPATAADDDTVFGFAVDGKKYALALWALKGTSYTSLAKGVFFTERRIGCLQKGYPTMNFSASTILKPYKSGNSTWIPVCVPRAKNTEAFLDFVRALLTGSVAPTSVPVEDSAE